MQAKPTNMRNAVKLSEVFADFLRHADNHVFLLPSLLMIAYVIVTDPSLSHLGWFLLGWLIFLPQEYLTHVYILHARLPKSRKWYRLMYRLHYGHHDLPRRADLMYMPLWLTLPMALGNILLFAVLSNTIEQWMMCLSGLFTGYLVFEFTHLLCHVPHNPKTAIGKQIKNRHLWHHYRNEKRWFSVSLPALLIDNLLGTAGSKDKTEQSATSKYLGLDAQHPWLLEARAEFAQRSSGNDDSSRIWLGAKQQ